MPELCDEHGGYAIERCTPFSFDDPQHRSRVKRGAWDDHGGTKNRTGQIAHDHAKAVVERHGDRDPVCLVVVAHHADKLGVVQDRTVTERGPLGETCGTRRVLDVDGIVGVEQCHPCAQILVGNRLAGSHQIRPLARIEIHHMFEIGTVRPHLLNHVLIRRGQVFGAGDEHFAARLVHCVFKFAGPIGRVDIDLNRSNLGGGKLHVDPLGVVRAPHADPVAFLDAVGHQTFGNGIDRRIEFGPALADALVINDQRVVVTEAGDGLIEVVADRLLDQRDVGSA